MANTELQDSKLKLVFNTGVDGDGNTVLKNKMFHNVRLVATADELYDVAYAIALLSDNPLFAVERNDNSLISE